MILLEKSCSLLSLLSSLPQTLAVCHSVCPSRHIPLPSDVDWERKLTDISRKIDGFSGREISKLVVAWQVCVCVCVCVCVWCVCVGMGVCVSIGSCARVHVWVSIL